MQDAWRDGPLTEAEAARLQRRARLAALANESQALGLYDEPFTERQQTAPNPAVTSSGEQDGGRGECAVAITSEQQRLCEQPDERTTAFNPY